MLPFDPATIATRLVAISYNTKPDLFDGKLGPRPHAISTAAVALADGLTYDGYEFDHSSKQCVFLALGNVLIDASANSRKYGLKPIDLKLLTLAEDAYWKHEQEARPRVDAVLSPLGL